MLFFLALFVILFNNLSEKFVYAINNCFKTMFTGGEWITCEKIVFNVF